MRIIERTTGNQSPEEVLRGELEKTDNVEYAHWRVALPINLKQIVQTFADEVDLTGNSKSAPGVANVDSTFTQQGLLQYDILVTGIRLTLSADPETFVLHGRFGQGSSGDSAIIDYGTPGWRMIYHMLNAYEIQIISGHRYIILSEKLSDVAYVKQPKAFEKHVERELVVKQHVIDINTRLAQTCVADKSFTPETYVTKSTPVEKEYVGLGATQPVHRLKKPVILTGGVPISARLRVTDVVHMNAMQNAMQLNSTVSSSLELPPVGEPICVIPCGDVHVHFGLVGCEITPEWVERLAAMSRDVDLIRGGSLFSISKDLPRQP